MHKVVEAMWILIKPGYDNRSRIQEFAWVLGKPVNKPHETEPVATHHDHLRICVVIVLAHGVKLKIHIFLGRLQPVKNRVMVVEPSGWVWRVEVVVPPQVSTGLNEVKVLDKPVLSSEPLA